MGVVADMEVCWASKFQISNFKLQNRKKSPWGMIGIVKFEFSNIWVVERPDVGMMGL
jgi:hypothetical protein